MQPSKRNKISKRPLCIFIADDNPDALMTLALVLREEGYVVYTCANANIALDVIRRERPDVCLLDIKMPGKSGYDLAREIVEACLVPEPVLIATSGHYKKPPEQLMARAVGFRHFIPKGAHPVRLLDILSTLSPYDDPPLAA